MHKHNKAPNYPARDFESLRTHIISCQKDLPKRLVQIAKYALQSPDEIAFGTTASIAKAAGVQPSTLVRLAHQLGYEGFSALQNIFRERLRSRPISYNERFNALESHRKNNGSEESILLNGFLTAARKSIDNFAANIAPETLEQAVTILAGAETIYLLAKRRSFPLIAHMAYSFGKLKIRYHIVGAAIGNDNELLEMASQKDAVVAISFSPYAPETISQVQIMVKNKVPIVAITDSPFSPLATYNSIWFEVVESDYAGFRSLSAGTAIIAALSVAVAKNRRQLDNVK